MATKKQNPNKGKYVSRSVYQKACEENKKLKIDIAIIVKEGLPSFEKLEIVKKWRDKIKQDNDFVDMLREILVPQMKFGPIEENPHVVSKAEIKKMLKKK